MYKHPFHCVDDSKIGYILGQIIDIIFIYDILVIKINLFNISITCTLSIFIIIPYIDKK